MRPYTQRQQKQNDVFGFGIDQTNYTNQKEMMVSNNETMFANSKIGMCIIVRMAQNHLSIGHVSPIGECVALCQHIQSHERSLNL